MARLLRLMPVACTALALLATSSPARADFSGADVLTCQFNAVLGPYARVPALLNPPAIAPMNVGFALTTAGVTPVSTCVEVRGRGLSSSQSVGFVNINAAGVYASDVCDTGTLVGNLNLNAPTLSPPDNVNSAFEIALAGGNGELVLTNATNSEDTGGEGAGYVNIVPDVANGGGDCVLNDGSRFKVTGAFTLVV